LHSSDSTFAGAAGRSQPDRSFDIPRLALSMTCSPFATVILLTNRYWGMPARRLTLERNFRLDTFAAAALVPVFWLMTRGN
jgi:hypothetical protein